MRRHYRKVLIQDIDGSIHRVSNPSFIMKEMNLMSVCSDVDVPRWQRRWQKLAGCPCHIEPGSELTVNFGDEPGEYHFLPVKLTIRQRIDRVLLLADRRMQRVVDALRRALLC